MSRSSQSGVEEFSTTLFEKFLALVLAVFVLIGSSWVYNHPLEFEHRVGAEPVATTSAADQTLEDRVVDTEFKLSDAHDILDAAKATRNDARERYRTQLDAGVNDLSAKGAYDRAEQKVTNGEASVRRLERELAQARTAAAPAEQRRRAAQRQIHRRYEQRVHTARVLTFVTRIAYGIAVLVFGFLLMRAMQRRHSRWTIIGMSIVGAGTIQALWFAGDYLDIFNRGALLLSLIGIALTIGVFLGYQRFLAVRIPRRRVRKGQCMFCGYPVAGHAHCEGCGRAAHASCTSCGEQRRVGALHCGGCGAA